MFPVVRGVHGRVHRIFWEGVQNRGHRGAGGPYRRLVRGELTFWGGSFFWSFFRFFFFVFFVFLFLLSIIVFFLSIIVFFPFSFVAFVHAVTIVRVHRVIGRRRPGALSLSVSCSQLVARGQKLDTTLNPKKKDRLYINIKCKRSLYFGTV